MGIKPQGRLSPLWHHRHLRHKNKTEALRSAFWFWPMGA
jgi:hypothetical protein